MLSETRTRGRNDRRWKKSRFDFFFIPRFPCCSVIGNKGNVLTPFYCVINSIYCTDCAHEHFQNDSNCPQCRKTLGPDDFLEVVVADPSSTAEDPMKNAFQTMFTKFSANENTLTHHEMCTRLMKILDNDRRTVKFLLKQFIVDSNVSSSRTGNLARSYHQLKEDHTKLQQAMSSQRIQTDQTIADLQHRVQALQGHKAEMQKKIDEKDVQIAQFRSLYAADGARMIPGSSHSSGSRDRHYNHHHPPQGSSHSVGGSIGSGGAPPPPPMQAFAENKKRKELAKQANLVEMTRSRGVLGQQQQQQPPPQQQARHNNYQSPHHQQQQLPHYGSQRPHQTQLQQNHHHSDVDSVITPIVPPPHSSASRHRAYSPGTPRIRDLAPSSGYNFSSRPSSKRLRDGYHAPSFSRAGSSYSSSFSRR